MTKSKRGSVGRIFSHKVNREDEEKRILRLYNLTKEEYNNLYEKQNGQCVICGDICKSHFDISINEMKKFHIDHCHKTDKVRGLLCGGCNTMIGYADDNIKILLSAVKYLRKNN